METNMLAAKDMFEIAKESAIKDVYSKILEAANSVYISVTIDSVSYKFKSYILDYFQNLNYKCNKSNYGIEISWADT